jgi:hypothetical protein
MIDLNNFYQISEIISDYKNNNQESKYNEFTVKNFDNLYLIKYKKSCINKDISNELYKFRSIVTDGKELYCVSPFKSIPLNEFNAYYEQWSQVSPVYPLLKMEFIEGTMINLFFNKSTDDWEIATKGNIGAKCKYNSNKTFRTMFLETMNEMGIEFNDFKKEFSYSFVLQHKDNKNVLPINRNALFIVGIYKLNEMKCWNIYFDYLLHQKDSQMWKIFFNNENINIYEPQYWTLSGEDWESEKNIFNDNNISYLTMGYVYISPEHKRIKIRNPNYEQIKRLKGNDPKMQYQYYYLRQNDLVKEFLKYFPEHNDTLLQHRKTLHFFTNQLYKHYVDCFIKKISSLKEYPFEFKPHMYELHRMYLNNLIGNNKSINYDIVKKYVNELPPAKLMYHVNYNLKQINNNQQKSYP